MNNRKLFFDKNEERISELTRKLSAADADIRERLLARIDRYRAAGPEYFAVYYDDTGTRRREKPEENTQAAAEALSRLRTVEVDQNEYNPPDKLSVTVKTMTRFFREMKNDSADTRTICKAIDEHLGSHTLKLLCKDRTILARHFKQFPRRDWSRKTIWNYYLKLRAVINLWIDFHQLTIANPAKIIPMITGLEPGTIVREQTPSGDDFRRLEVACVEANVPQELVDLFSAVRLSGLRVTEVLALKVEDLSLDLKIVDEQVVETPWFRHTVLKQKRRTVHQVPMSIELWRILQRIVGDRKSGPLFPAWKNPPYKRIRHLGIMKAAGMSDFRPFHDYRKSFKTDLKADGASSEITKYLQGHASDSMDDHYTQFKRRHVQGVFMPEYQEFISTNSATNSATNK
jgi:integrase